MVHSHIRFMKLTLAAIISLLAQLPLCIQGQCLPSSEFEVTISAPCSYNRLLLSIQQMLDYPDPLSHKIIPCPHSAETELLAHVALNETYTTVKKMINKACADAYDEYDKNNTIPFSDITLKGNKFDKEYYDGNGDWNEEHQSNYPHPPVVAGEPSNILSRDAERVDELYEKEIQHYPLQWPSMISNFENCELNSAMCCWVSDRQANDNNGNCKTPYDNNCLDADPGDNTDLCAVDMRRSGDASHVDNGFVVFPGGVEGPVHCHGIAWGENELEADYRYRANNLFYVSMSDHLHDRGYVRNVQGAPMCGCVEKMPIVSRSDCTEITAHEIFKFKFPDNYSGEVKASLDYVDLDFNACNAKQNNNLQRFYERLKDEGRISNQKYQKFRNTVVGDNKCAEAIRDVYFDMGYQYKEIDVDDFGPALDGYCLNLIGTDQKSGVIKLSNVDHGQDSASQEKCLKLCASQSSEHKVTGCEAVWDKQHRGCYLHTQVVARGNGENMHKCWVKKKYEPIAVQDFLPVEKGYCTKSNGTPPTSGVMKLAYGDFGPDEIKQEDCRNKCIAVSSIYKVTGCQAVWGKGNGSGCFFHTDQNLAYGNSMDNYSCYLVKKLNNPVKLDELLPKLPGACVKKNGDYLGYLGGVVLLESGDFGPDESKQTECVNKCIAASAERKITGCQAVWDKDNRGCYIHTSSQVFKASGILKHSCWLV